MSTSQIKIKMKNTVSFDEMINGDKPVLVDFSAAWCGPCKAMEPILSEVAREVGDSASIVKIDVDQNPTIARRLDIRAVPTLILYSKGVATWRHSGMQSASALSHLIRQTIGQNQ